MTPSRPRPGSRLSRNVLMDLGQCATTVKFLIRDRAGQFTSSFDAVFAAEGIRILASPPLAPRANAICERIIGTLRREVLDRDADRQRGPPATGADRIPPALQRRPAAPLPSASSHQPKPTASRSCRNRLTRPNRRSHHLRRVLKRYTACRASASTASGCKYPRPPA